MTTTIATVCNVSEFICAVVSTTIFTERTVASVCNAAVSSIDATVDATTVRHIDEIVFRLEALQVDTTDTIARSQRQMNFDRTIVVRLSHDRRILKF